LTWINGARSRGCGAERAAVLAFTGDLTLRELEHAHDHDLLAALLEHAFGNPQVALADDDIDLVQLAVWTGRTRGLDIVAPGDGRAELGLDQDGVAPVDAMRLISALSRCSSPWP